MSPKATDADPDTYYLVDLSRYRGDANVGWDPAYLATTVTAFVTTLLVPSLDWRERKDLTDLLIDPSRGPREKRLNGIHACLAAMNVAAMALTAEQGLKSEWQRQMLLCLLASSLVLSGRSILAARDREFFFWVAAHAATHFARTKKLGSPEDSEDPLRLDGPLIDSSLTNESASDPLVRSAGDERRRHQYEDDAKILQFPRRSTTGGDVGAAAAEDSTLSPGTWADLVHELRQVEFDPTNWRYLAASTERLRNELARTRPPHPSSEKDISRHLEKLEQTLIEVLKPSAMQEEIRAACESAGRRRSWLLHLLT